MSKEENSKENSKKIKEDRDETIGEEFCAKIFTSIPMDEAWKFVENSLSEIKKQQEYIQQVTYLLELEPESPLRAAFYVIIDNLIESLEMLVGDNESMIEWFVYENDFGSKEMAGGCSGKARKIKTLEDLRWLIELSCADLRESDSNQDLDLDEIEPD